MHADALATLAAMGFADADMLVPMLDAHKGNVAAVINVLLG